MNAKGMDVTPTDEESLINFHLSSQAKKDYLARFKAEGKKKRMYKQLICEFLSKNKGKFKGTDLMLNLSIPEQGLYKALRDLVKQKEIKKENHLYWIEKDKKKER